MIDADRLAGACPHPSEGSGPAHDYIWHRVHPLAICGQCGDVINGLSDWMPGEDENTDELAGTCDFVIGEDGSRRRCAVPIGRSRTGKVIHLEPVPKGIDPDHEATGIIEP